MAHGHLKLNMTQTELLVLVPQVELPLGLLISANGNAIFPVDQTRNLKVILDPFLSLKSMFKSSLRNILALSSLDSQASTTPHPQLYSGLSLSLQTLPPIPPLL